MRNQAPNDFVVPPALLPADSTPATPSHVPAAAADAKSSPAKLPGRSLIDRYGLTSRVPSVDKGKEREGEGEGESGKWEASKEARERGLRERKEKMILEARRSVSTGLFSWLIWSSEGPKADEVRRMMEKQQAAT